MDNTNYILENLLKFKNDGINVNDFCNQVCANLGISPTNEIIRLISRLLEQYKEGMINDSTVIENFNNIVATYNTASGNASQGNYSNYAANRPSSTNANTTVDETPKEEVNQGPIDTDDSSTNAATPQHEKLVVNSESNEETSTNTVEAPAVDSNSQTDSIVGNDGNNIINTSIYNINANNSTSNEPEDNSTSNDANTTVSDQEEQVSSPSEPIEEVSPNPSDTETIDNGSISNETAATLGATGITGVITGAVEASAQTNEAEKNVDSESGDSSKEVQDESQTPKEETPVVGRKTVNNSPKEETKEEATVDIDSDKISEIANNCSDIDSGLSGLNVKIPAEMEKYTSGIPDIILTIVSMSKLVNKFINVLWNTLAAYGACDSDADAEELNWGDVKNAIDKYNKAKNRKMVEADEEFFAMFCDGEEDCIEEIVVNKKGKTEKVARFKRNDKVYEYNLSTKVLTFEDGTSIKATIYVPENASKEELAHFNTYTYFTQNGAGTSSDERIKAASKTDQPFVGNAILIRINKTDVRAQKATTVTLKVDEGEEVVYNAKKGDFVKRAETANATRFINELVGTDLKDHHCRNIIAGDSVYGTHAIQLKADNPGLYDTVYCLDNAVIVTGINGKENSTKERITTAQLKRLEKDGGDIYFWSTRGDDNYATYSVMDGTRGKDYVSIPGAAKGTPSKEAYQLSFTYTGMEILGRECPSVGVHAVYQNSEINKNKKVANLTAALDELAATYQNITNDSEFWDDGARKKYTGHSEGPRLVTDLLEFVVTCANYYYHE